MNRCEESGPVKPGSMAWPLPGVGYYHTGGVASRDADGYITYTGRLPNFQTNRFDRDIVLPGNAVELLNSAG
jgi:hypothetical protein